MSDLQRPFFHIAEPDHWAQAGDGDYRWSTRGATLEQVGYIHCSYLPQVEPVAAMVYSDRAEGLLLLTIDPSRVTAEIRVENLQGGDVLFPHIYGPLPVAAVTQVAALVRDGERWALPT